MEENVDVVTEEDQEKLDFDTEDTAEELKSDVSEEESEDFEKEDKLEEKFLEVKERGVKKEKEFEEEDIVEERFYTIPLRKVWIAPRKKRAPKAVRLVKSFVIKHMKIRMNALNEEEEPEKLVIANEVNEKLWSRGIEKPPRKIRVRVVKDKEGIVNVLLAEGD